MILHEKLLEKIRSKKSELERDYPTNSQLGNYYQTFQEYGWRIESMLVVIVMGLMTSHFKN